MSYGIDSRCSSDPVLLWLWHRLAVAAPIQPLDWELPCAVGAAPSPKKTQNKTKQKKPQNKKKLLPGRGATSLPGISQGSMLPTEEGATHVVAFKSVSIWLKAASLAIFSSPAFYPWYLRPVPRSALTARVGELGFKA